MFTIFRNPAARWPIGASMRICNWATLWLGAAVGWGCTGPALDLPGGTGSRPIVEFDPQTADDSVALVFRARLRDAPAQGTPWLFQGELSSYYARALRQGDVPSSLRTRAVPLRFWRTGTDCWMQPSAWLEPDASYTLAFTGLGALRLVFARAPSLPPVTRIFPPPRNRKYRVAVVCDAGSTAELLPPLTLEPGAVSLRATPGIAGLASPGCMTLVVDGDLSESAVAAPVLGGALLEPSPWLPASERTADSAPTCAAGGPFHGACLEVLDDRLRVTAGVDDLLFTLDEPQTAFSVVGAGTRGSLLRGLSPGTQLSLSGSVLSSLGELDVFHLVTTTATARRHLVLNEVLANPVGPEPGGEWIELGNDSERPVSLAELWLEDASGHIELPDTELLPGELALLVSDGFRASSLDAPIPEQVRLLRVPTLGARGLSNSGEALLLVGREGVLSRFPLVAAAHAGRSIARRALDDADDDPTAFTEHAGPGASPGAPNQVGD